MTLTVEASTWDEERIQQEIAIRLNPGWGFKIDASEDETEWVVTITDEQNIEVWRGSELTAQLVLLTALGWLENSKHKIPEGSLWVRRQGELNPQRVHDVVYSKILVPGDPPDLDPDELDSLVNPARKGG